ncbi:DUF932 domain-containing protein [Tessaracoccus sp.]
MASHSIDTTNGVSTLLVDRPSVWGLLGVNASGAFTAEEAMTAGHMGGWNVRKVPATVTVDGVQHIIPGKYGVVRNNPVAPSQVDVWGTTVGSVHHILQNEEMADLLNYIVDEGGAHFETAGAMNGGRQTFITMALPSTLLVGGVDRVDLKLAGINSFDGSTQITIMATPVRFACMNVLNVALGKAASVYKIRHTRGAERLIRANARQALDLTFKFSEAFQLEAEQMIQTTLTEATFAAIVEREFGPAEDAAKSTVTRSNAKVEEMVALFTNAPTQANIRGTVWAGYNALTEWADHFSPTRGEDRDEARATNAILRPELKVRARELMMALV